jgi:hypothetical protein
MAKKSRTIPETKFSTVYIGSGYRYSGSDFDTV